MQAWVAWIVFRNSPKSSLAVPVLTVNVPEATGAEHSFRVTTSYSATAPNPLVTQSADKQFKSIGWTPEALTVPLIQLATFSRLWEVDTF